MHDFIAIVLLAASAATAIWSVRGLIRMHK